MKVNTGIDWIGTNMSWSSFSQVSISTYLFTFILLCSPLFRQILFVHMCSNPFCFVLPHLVRFRFVLILSVTFCTVHSPSVGFLCILMCSIALCSVHLCLVISYICSYLIRVFLLCSSPFCQVRIRSYALNDILLCSYFGSDLFSLIQSGSLSYSSMISGQFTSITSVPSRLLTVVTASQDGHSLGAAASLNIWLLNAWIGMRWYQILLSALVFWVIWIAPCSY